MKLSIVQETINLIVSKIDQEELKKAPSLKGLSKKQAIVYISIFVNELLEKYNHPIRYSSGKYFIFVGSHWEQVTKKEIKTFLEFITVKCGANKIDVFHYEFGDELYKQFRSMTKEIRFSKPKSPCINCANGTLTFMEKGAILKSFDKSDYLRYKLKYDYNPDAQYPKFQKFLDDILSKDAQLVVQEYIGNVFVSLNLQKMMTFCGSGANGKGVLMEIISAALGKENITQRSLEGICATESRSVADLEGKLMNICTESSAKFNLSNFKTLTSGDPIEARRLYEEPHTIYDYAMLLFSCNELPKQIEQTEAFFRRLIPVPFLRHFTEEEQDPMLAKKIIKSELSGVLNWIIEGAQRLMLQGHYSKSKAISKVIEEYRIESDSVVSFMEDYSYQKSVRTQILLSDLFMQYLDYCKDSNCHSCSKKTFANRLRGNRFQGGRNSIGVTFFVERKENDIETNQLESWEDYLCKPNENNQN